MSSLRRHVPRLALQWAADCPQEQWRQVDGTLCFADVSGFTALAERLAQQGRMGGEELVETLGQVFAGMLEIARQRGGSLLKFGGDALLLFFRGDDHALQGAAAAVEMREALRLAARMQTSVGPLRLKMSVGLHTGPADFFLVGGAYRELILLGPAADQVINLESAANAGEIVISAGTAGRLPAGAVRPRADGALLLRWRRAPVAAPGPIEEEERGEDLAASLFPAELGRHLAAGPPEPEHRVACVAFVRFSGTDAVLSEQGPEVLADLLGQTVTGVQAILSSEGVSLLAIDLDRDGGKFFLVSGVPRAHEDDEGVMLRALRRVMDAGLPLSLQAGVCRGHVFAAEVGAQRRAAFSAMGDTTNTAARIAAQTPAGSIYAHPAVLDESLTLFEVTRAGPLRMKGKTAPQLVYSVGAELGLRAREGLDVDLFVGRKEALAALTDAIAAVSDAGGGVLTVTGGTGSGKTRLLREALRRVPESLILPVRAEPYGAANPYRMFRDPLRKLLGIEQADDESLVSSLRAAVSRLDPSLSPWLPLLGDVLRIPVQPTEEVALLAAEFRPARTADVVVSLLSAACAGMLVVPVDDAHWCDQASSELLARLETACADRPWILLVARREVDGGYLPEGGAQLSLGPMPDADMRRLVHIATEAAPLRPQIVDTIVGRAAGVPLFAMELLRAVRDIGTMEALPESLEGALTAQVDALDRPARQVLSYGSVLGRSFSGDALAEVFAAEGQAYDPTVLERLQRYLREDQPGHYRFRSTLLRDTVYEGLSFRLRKRLHRHAAMALEAGAADADAVAHDLALHFSRGEDHPRALHYALEAGRQAKAAYANAEAAQDFQMAMAAARRAAAGRARLVEIWQELGETRERAGFIDGALEAYRRGLRLLRDEPVKRAGLLCDLAWAKHRAGRLTSALRSIGEGIRLVSGDESRKAVAVLARLLSLRSTIYFVQDRPKLALAAAEAALPVARSADEKESLVRALNIMETANLVLTGSSSGAHLKEALEIADGLGDRGLQAMLAGTLSGLCYYDNRWDEAVAGYRTAHALYEQAGNYLDGAYMLVNLGEILSRQGRPSEARRHLTEALRIMRAADFPEGVANSEMELARVALLQGDPESALDLAERAATAFAALDERHFVLQADLLRAEALMRRGEWAFALELTDTSIDRARGDAAYLKSKSAIIRARALMALERWEEASVEIEQGIDASRQQRARYDEALLLRLKSELSQRLGRGEVGADLDRAAGILAGLGAVL